MSGSIVCDLLNDAAAANEQLDCRFADYLSELLPPLVSCAMAQYNNAPALSVRLQPINGLPAWSKLYCIANWYP